VPEPAFSYYSHAPPVFSG